MCSFATPPTGRVRGRSLAIHRVTDSLYVSSYRAITEERLRALGITFIVNCTSDLSNRTFATLRNIEYLQLNCWDIPTENLRQHFHPVSDMIRRVREQGGNTLVHCARGISRSVALCLAYQVKHEGVSLRRAFCNLRTTRPLIRPNPGFWVQLVGFEVEIRGASSIKILAGPKGLRPDVYDIPIHEGKFRVTAATILAMAGFFTQIARITDNLYLSGASSLAPRRLEQHGITHVINCTIDVANARANNIVEVLRISLDDTPHSRLDVHFDRCADKIKHVADRGGKTLVHCVAGVSRSATICMVYLMKHQRMTLKEAYHHVKARRPVIRPNPGFFRQMIEYEKRLFGRNSVTMVSSPIGFVPTVYKEETRNMVW